MTVEQQKMLVELEGLKDQIGKEHYLNVHFRLAHDAWQEHIRQNARVGCEVVHSPPGAILDEGKRDN